MSDIGIHEQPLNERYRLFLRAEQLFERLDHHLAGEQVWDTHAALIALLELFHAISRGDSKLELIKELDRQNTALSRFDQRSAVDAARLHGLLEEQRRLLDALHARTGTIGQELRGNELLNQLQQRASAGGRPGVLDLPGYQEWLQRPAAERHREVRAWLGPLDPARDAIQQCLALVREAVDWQRLEARGGFHEQALEPRQPIQLLRVRLDPGQTHRFPEISAGRQRFTIRFFEQRSPADRATQVREDIPFDLACSGV